MQRTLRKNYHTLIQLFFVLTLSIYPTNYGTSQENNIARIESNPNAIYSNLGFGYRFRSLSAMVYYERYAKSYPKFTSFYKVGIGATTSFFDGDFLLLAQYGILTGSKSNHLELGIGPNLEIVKTLTKKLYLPITSTIGWRIQKPGGHFILRTGISWPEGTYFGFCVSF